MKLPCAKALEFLLLARNKYVAITEYLSAYKVAEVTGSYLKGFEARFKKLSDIDELSYLEKTQPSLAPEKNSLGQIEVHTQIPKELIKLKEKLCMSSSLYDNPSVKFIFENIMLRRSVEVYLTSKMTITETTKLINDKFRIVLTDDDINSYKYWFYDLGSFSPSALDDYFKSLPKEEKDYKLMAYMNKEDYVKWKMQDDCELDPQLAVKKIMADAFYNLQETLKLDKINHAAAKTWSDIFFKAIDYINKEGNGNSDTSIFSKFKFTLTKENDDKIIAFEDLVKEDTK